MIIREKKKKELTLLNVRRELIWSFEKERERQPKMGTENWRHFVVKIYMFSWKKKP